MTAQEAFDELKGNPVFIRGYIRTLAGSESEKIPVVRDLVAMILELLDRQDARS